MVCALACFVLAPSLADRVLVVINGSSPVSTSVGADYMRLRMVKQKVVVQCQDSAKSAADETIAYPSFQKSIETPLRAYLQKHPQIDFIVLTKGIPIRITDAPGLGISNKQPSLDSFLAALDYSAFHPVKVALSDGGFTGTAWANRFWDAKERFSHKKFGGYLVTRLDGYTEEDAKMLVRWSLAAEKRKPTGTILLDTCPSFGYDDPAKEPLPIFNGKPDPENGAKSLNEIAYKHYNADMERAAEVLGKRGIPVRLEKTDAFVQGADLIGYCSWGSNDSHFDAGNYSKLRFAPGALAETAVSTSARTFLPTTGGQSLIADLVAGNVTGVKGYCDEPLLQAVASPTILFDRYTRGWTLAESFYAASRFVGWEDIVVGDPICRPYR
ncbi:MAG TPA: TIGR03790 family protein [Fimbriimonas sp.]|nr:TIGR03790 family protein [Fimbriimonas sp.]